MTNEELLLAMSKMLEPIREDIREIKCDISELKRDVAELKVRVSRLEADVAELKQDVAQLKQDVAELKQDVAVLQENMADLQSRVKKIEVTMETNFSPRLQTIEACYTTTYDRYRTSVEDYENMKQDISVLKTVVMEHSNKIQKIS